LAPPGDDHDSGVRRQRPLPPPPGTEQVLKVRGNLVFTRKALTEGPYRFKDFGHKFWDGAEATILVEERFDREAWVLGWEPVVSQHRCPNGTLVELIHHMNILAKTEDEVASLFPPGETLHHGSDGAEHIKALAL